MYGVDVLQYIHIISGRKLLRQGIRILQDMNGIRHTSGSTKFWYKGRLVKARKFIIPDEYKIDKHRRRRFMVQRDMLDIFYDESLNHLGWQPKERFLVKALRFQGFTPVSKYRMRSKYAYIMTNRMLENEYWVFPMRLADNYKSMQNPKYKFYTEVFGKVGIPGIIKIKYSNGN